MRRRALRRTSARRFRPAVEAVERRELLSGQFFVTNTNDSGPGSLRQAILNENASQSGGQAIGFDIPGSGVHTIVPLSPLPALTVMAAIDGSSQPGFAGTPLIELDGELAGPNANGLTCDGGTYGGNVVIDLVINRFSNAGIDFGGGPNARFFGCRIGTDPTGTIAEGNGTGVLVATTWGVDSSNLTKYPADVDVVSGNLGWGIHCTNPDHASSLADCYVGTDVTGTHALPNGSGGIFVDGSGVSIARCVISGNRGDGVYATGNPIYNLGPIISDSEIGTDPGGTIALPNQGDGIREEAGKGGLYLTNTVISANTGDGIYSATPSLTIADCFVGTNRLPAPYFSAGGPGNGFDDPTGYSQLGALNLGNGGNGIVIDTIYDGVGKVNTGALSPQGNVIAYNGRLTTGDGIVVRGNINGIQVRANDIFGNSGLGIDLGGTGVTYQDTPAGVASSGANHLLNYPVLTSAVSTTSGTTITGYLDSPGGFGVHLDFFANDRPGPSGYGQGQIYLGAYDLPFASVVARVPFSVTLPFANLGSETITSTTDAEYYGVSDFSQGIVATGSPRPLADLSVAIGDLAPPLDGGSLDYQVSVTNNGPLAATNVTLQDTLPAGVPYVGASTPQGTVSQANGVVTAILGTLAVGATVVVTIHLRPNSTGPILDSATVSGGLPDLVPANNQATFSDTVLPVADLSVAISTSAPRAVVGNDFTYTVVVTNAGPDAASGVTLTDVLPANATLGNDSVTQGTVTYSADSRHLVATLGTLAAHGSASLVFHVRASATGTLADSASAKADQADLTPASASASLNSAVVAPSIQGDYDGDGKADIGIYGKDPATGKYDFRVLTSSSNFKSTLTFDNSGFGYGNAQSIPVPGDYFGDGRSAYALWTPNAQGGMTLTAVSQLTGKGLAVGFGGTHDAPVVADVDGDGRADFGVYGFQPGLGYRFDFLLSSKNFSVNQQDVFNNSGYGYGNAQAIPVVADFDGSGKAGFGLFIPSAGGSVFAYVSASGGVGFTRAMGGPSDVPAAVGYDGDGKADLALYGPDPARPGHYRYTVLTSGSGYEPTKAVSFDNSGFGYGGPSSTPVVADYEGTGKADFALYLPSARGMQYIYQASQTGGGVVLDFAGAGDLPLTAPAYLIAKKVRGY